MDHPLYFLLHDEPNPEMTSFVFRETLMTHLLFWGNAYSPIAMAKNAIGMAIDCEEYGAKFFANGAAPSGVLEHPGTIKDPSRVRASWQSTFDGSANANKVAVLEEGMKYTPISISPNEA